MSSWQTRTRIMISIQLKDDDIAQLQPRPSQSEQNLIYTADIYTPHRRKSVQLVGWVWGYRDEEESSVMHNNG